MSDEPRFGTTEESCTLASSRLKAQSSLVLLEESVCYDHSVVSHSIVFLYLFVLITEESFLFFSFIFISWRLITIL